MIVAGQMWRKNKRWNFPIENWEVTCFFSPSLCFRKLFLHYFFFKCIQHTCIKTRFALFHFMSQQWLSQEPGTMFLKCKHQGSGLQYLHENTGWREGTGEADFSLWIMLTSYSVMWKSESSSFLWKHLEITCGIHFFPYYLWEWMFRLGEKCVCG